jgi:putative hemolysin
LAQRDFVFNNTEKNMKDLPNPTQPLSLIQMPRGGLHRPAAPADAADSRGGIRVTWARHQDEVRRAQQLRYQVFAEEMGAQLSGPLPGHDGDLFDDFCEHLIVTDTRCGEVVGTYQAARVGSFYADLEFDLTRLRHWRSRMVELGRSCVHRDYRHGGVILALWSALAQFMARNRLDMMIGCASIPMQHQGLVGGHAAASIWRQLKQTHLAPVDCHVLPRLALPLEQLDDSLDVQPPALIRGYLRLGAKVLGPPAWDPDFNTADLPMMMRVQDLSERYRRHFHASADVSCHEVVTSGP